MNIKFFRDIGEEDRVGGKGASLAKLYQNKFNIPNGYVIMANMFDDFLKENNVKEKIQRILKRCNIDDEKDIENKSNEIIQIVSKCYISDSMKKEIINNFKKLNCKYVAVRSSATSEDGKSHAWAGQLDSFLNVNETNILESIKKCWISIFNSRAIFYRLKNNDTTNISVAVIVQEMLQSDMSGIAFSINPTNNNPNEIVVEGILGLGEAIVSGKVTPDTYIIDKENLKLISKTIQKQKIKLIKVNNINKFVELQDENLQKIEDKIILELSTLIKKVEKFYNFPVDIEFGISDRKIYILQCRPITTVKKNELIDRLKQCGSWKFYVSRQFNWFVENTEIYASLEKYQKELLGFEIATQNYLCLNGDEYLLDLDFETLCNKLDSYLQNDFNFFEKFAKIEFDLVEKIKKYLIYLKNKDLSKLNFKELYKEMEKFNDLYIKSFIPGMTRPEDFLVDRLKNELNNTIFTKKEIDIILTKISTCPNYFPLSYSEEPLDLLKIALEYKNGKNIEGLIKEHLEKYSWIKGPVEFEDTTFTKEDYLSRLNNLINEDIEEKIKNIYNVRKNNDIEYKKILEQYKFTEKAKKLIKAIRNFIFLRTYTTEYSDHLFFTGRHTIFKEITNRTNIADKDLIMLDDKEILDILKNQGIMSKEIKNTLENRKKGFAMIWLDGNVQKIFGEESLKLQDEIAKTYKILNHEENNKSNNKIVSGNIANRGKVKGIARVLTTYQDIYNVKKGDIIVATMTTPDYVSAMEKASGFITDEGGVTCHAAILSREFNVPCIVGTINGTKAIQDGQMIELDAYTGIVYILE